MKTKRFIFAVMTYDQENIVIETLESIKYQINKYGENIYNKLILIDDASSDETFSLIQKWIEKNNELLDEVI